MPLDAGFSADVHRALAGGARRSAEVIAPLVLQLVAPNSVVDVGCGLGSWLSVFRHLGVERILGVDSAGVAPPDLQIPSECYLRHDLTQPLALGGPFDLVVSLEVAEHLPAESAGTFADTLVGLGPVLLFSAAIPYQGGYHHVNEQWPHYWVDRFHDRGMEVVDAIRPVVWQDDRVEWWYAQNTLLFARPDVIARRPALQRAHETTNRRQLALVHPRNYARLWGA